MRLLLGIILGVVLTVGGAYLYDSNHAFSAENTPASAGATAHGQLGRGRHQVAAPDRARPRRMGPPRRVDDVLNRQLFSVRRLVPDPLALADA